MIWMKFTSDGYLGVVATSNDVNFAIPKDKSECNLKEWQDNKYTKRIKKFGNIIRQKY